MTQTAIPLSERLPELVRKAPMGEVKLPPDMRQEVIFRKYQSTNPMLTDIVFGEEIHDQIIEHERLGLTDDDGCIIDIIGRRTGQVGITRDGEVLTDEQVQMREEANPNRRIPRYVQYLFTVEKIVKTNGPKLRENLLATQEQQRLRAEESLIGSLDKLIASKIAPGETVSDREIQQHLMGLSSMQRKAMLEMAEAEAEYEQEQAEEQAAAKKK